MIHPSTPTNSRTIEGIVAPAIPAGIPEREAILVEGAIREVVEAGIQAVEEGIRAVEADTLEAIQEEEATQAVLAVMAGGTRTATMEEAAATATIITLSQEEEDHHQTKTPS
jgi:hypothetical protein